MRLFAIALILSAAAGAARADDARFASFQAPDGNVVELGVGNVAVPDSLPGVCTVEARISRVWIGTAFRAGQHLTLEVPCGGNRLIQATARFDGIVPVNADALSHSRRAIARLDDEGRIMWQSNLTPYGQWGAVTGYRVLEGRLMPLTRS